MSQQVGASLSPEEQKIIDQELALHENVKQAVRAEAMAAVPDMNDVKKRLIELRDEAISAHEHDLPALFQQLYTHHSLAARDFTKKLPDMRAPYFAHVQTLENGRTRDILIGYQTFIDTKVGVTIIDWRHAAMAKVFFNYREGEEYELDLPGRVAVGTLTMRRIITFDGGELTGVSAPAFNLVRERGQTWYRYGSQSTPDLSGGAGTAVNVQQFGIGITNRKLPDVSALLDQDQYEILRREDRGALLILGGAGSGKTTVALHRMALLSYQRPGFYAPRFMQVVVPEQGLVRLTERLLGGLGLNGVKVNTLDTWMTDQGRHILKRIPKRVYEWTPPAVVYIKRHPALLKAMEALAAKKVADIASALRGLIGDWGSDLIEFLNTSKAPLVPRLDALLERAKDQHVRKDAPQPSKWQLETLSKYLNETKENLVDGELTRSELYGDLVCHAALIEHSDGHINAKMLAELTRHTRRQFEEPQKQHAEANDEAGLDVEGSEVEVDDYAGTIDVEDFAVLLEWLHLIHGRVTRKSKSLTEYHHLVIDEAQDLAPLELRILGQSLSADSTLTVAGDAAQQSDPSVVFRGWDDALAQLDVAETSEARLSTNYRCPRPVAELGHKVLGAMAPGELPKSIREGRDVVFTAVPNEGLAVVEMTDVLNQLSGREPLASVAIICENEENARHFYEALSGNLDVRLVIDGEFSFKPGIDITYVSQVKGLEFDYVVLPDVNLGVYPNTPVARKSLHIAITRAVHQLWVMSVGKKSDILTELGY
jgi:DNA helicase-2/ATP-dependent DNA helicase PcrA